MKEKKINTIQLLVILLCNTVGAGIFFVPSDIMKYTEDKKLSLLCWGLCYIVAVMFGLCYAELGSTYPYEGGDAWYLKLAYGSVLSNTFSFLSVCVVLPCSCSVMSKIMVETILDGKVKKAMYIKMIIFLILFVLTLLNWFGNKYVYKMQYLLTILKMIVVVLFLGLAALVFFKLVNLKKIIEKPPIESLPTDIKDNNIFSNLLRIINGMLLVLWSYDGWNSGNFIAHTIQKPGRSLPIAIVSSCTIVGVIYLFINLSFFNVLSIETIKENRGLLECYFDHLQLPETFKKITSKIFHVIPLLGSLSGSYLVASSIIDSYIFKLELSDDKQEDNIQNNNNTKKERCKKFLKSDMFKKLVALNIFTFLVFYFTTIDVEKVIGRISFLMYLFYGLSIFGILILRNKDRNVERPFKVPRLLIYACILISIFVTINIIRIEYFVDKKK